VETVGSKWSYALTWCMPNDDDDDDDDDDGDDVITATNKNMVNVITAVNDTMLAFYIRLNANGTMQMAQWRK